MWSFSPAEVTNRKRGNYKVKAWPALVDEHDSVAIKLFDNPQEQQRANDAVCVACLLNIRRRLSICTSTE
ncbi:DUF3418 domain-containing protein [Klebsiella pneumoniae]|nr:DUF3418 domain-containing protein [Klebsiella pneumoniae]